MSADDRELARRFSEPLTMRFGEIDPDGRYTERLETLPPFNIENFLTGREQPWPPRVIGLRQELTDADARRAWQYLEESPPPQP